MLHDAVGGSTPATTNVVEHLQGVTQLPGEADKCTVFIGYFVSDETVGKIDELRD